MTTLMDIVTSTLIFGILVLTVGRIQTNINNNQAQNHYNVIVQSNSVELARLLEYDFAKIGFHTVGQKITFADTNSIIYRADVGNTFVVKTISYTAGTTDQLTNTANPNDFLLTRTINGMSTDINYGLTAFRLNYYDSADSLIPTPITTVAELNRIKGIRIRFTVQSSETVPSDIDTTYEAVSWEKIILPRNLSNLNY